MLRSRPLPAPPRDTVLSYGRHLIEEDDVAAVVDALRSDMLTQGPRVEAFEKAFAQSVGSMDAVACTSGTAGLHLSMAALDLRPGEVCIVPAITFLSTATAARFCGAEVVFADVDPTTGLMTPDTLEEALKRFRKPVRAIAPVHLGGRMADVISIAGVADRIGADVIEDCCHALGSVSATSLIAGGCAWSSASVFSFHAIKTIACGEGGMVTVNDPMLAERMRRLRNHGVTREPGLMLDPELSLDETGAANPWSYEQLELGFNYRMTDIEAALGLSQLAKLDRFVEQRGRLASLYDRLVEPLAPLVYPVRPEPGEQPGLHLYQVRVDFRAAGVSRARLMRELRSRGVGAQVHYIPIYRQPYFANRYGAMRLPGAEAYYAQTLSLPLFPAMTAGDVARVMRELSRALGV